MTTKNFLRQMVLRILSLFFSGLGNRALILMYHSVGNNTSFSTVTPERFEQQMEFLAKGRWRITRLGEICGLVKNAQGLEGRVAVTFDDGYEDFYHNAYPILIKYRIPATVFVITGFLGKRVDFLKNETISMINKTQMIEMTKSGLIEFMPHTRTHPDLKKIDLAMAINEIEGSRKDVEEITRQSANILAYPKGRFTGEVIEYLRRSGKWAGACTVEAGLVHLHDGPYKLRRLSVDSTTTVGIFKSMFSRAFDVYQALKLR